MRCVVYKSTQYDDRALSNTLLFIVFHNIRTLSVDEHENVPPNAQETNWRLAVFEEVRPYHPRHLYKPSQVDRFLLSLPLTDSERDCHIEELVARHLYKASLQWHGTQQQLQQRYAQHSTARQQSSPPACARCTTCSNSSRSTTQ